MWIKAFEAEPGENIEHACQEANRIARQFQMTVWFEFNAVHMHAKPHISVKEMVEGYHLALECNTDWMVRQK